MYGAYTIIINIIQDIYGSGTRKATLADKTDKKRPYDIKVAKGLVYKLTQLYRANIPNHKQPSGSFCSLFPAILMFLFGQKMLTIPKLLGAILNTTSKQVPR